MSCLERRKREKEEIRKSILDAARSIAAKDGWHSVTIRKIADSIEYTPPIVYEHFENKEDIIRELINTGFNIMFEESEATRKTETDSKKLLMKLSLIHWDFAFNNSELYQLMFSLERPVPTDEMNVNVRLIENTFMTLANQDKELTHELIFNWMCLMHGAISIFMKTPHLPHQGDRQPRDLYSSVIKRFIDGI